MGVCRFVERQRVLYGGREYIVCKCKERKQGIVYDLVDYGDSSQAFNIPEADLTPIDPCIKDLVKEEKKSSFKYNIGDRVIYTGPNASTELLKNQEYTICNYYNYFPGKVNFSWNNAYQLKDLNGFEIPIWVLEKDLTTAWEKEESGVEIDDSGDFKYDIDDHVFFNGHEQVIVRKMHIGLNKYYKIRHVDDDSTHCYIVSEYALDKNCITKKEDDILNAPTKEYHPNKKGTAKVSGEFHSTGYTGVGEFHPTGNTGFVGGFIKTSSDREIDARDKSSLLPNLMRTLNIYPKGVRVIDEGLEDKYHDYKYNMTIMISQPLSNKSKEEVEKIRNAAIMRFVYSENVPKPEDVKPYYIRVVDNLQYDRIPTEDEGELNHFDYLSTDIKLMKDIDYIIFAYGWQNSKGCNIEYQMAKTYGIPMYFA